MVTGNRIRAIDILRFMGRQGIRYPKKELNKTLTYVERMINDQRVIIIEHDGCFHTAIFFSICNDFEPFLKKGNWEYKAHNPDGNILYVEKAVSLNWTRELRNRIKALILSLYPKLCIGKWHRYGKIGDREVTVRRYRHALT